MLDTTHSSNKKSKVDKNDRSIREESDNLLISFVGMCQKPALEYPD